MSIGFPLAEWTTVIGVYIGNIVPGLTARVGSSGTRQSGPKRRDSEIHWRNSSHFVDFVTKAFAAHLQTIRHDGVAVFDAQDDHRGCLEPSNAPYMPQTSSPDMSGRASREE